MADYDFSERGDGSASDKHSHNPPEEASCCAIVVAGIRLLLDDSLPTEVIYNPSYSPMPNAPSHMLGLCSLDAYVLPLYNLGYLLGVPSPPRYERYLKVGTEQDALLLGIDEEPNYVLVDELEAIADSVLESFHLGKYVTQSYKYNDVCWSLLDGSALFDALSSYFEMDLATT